MKLRAITIRRMPGIDRRFTLQDLSPGINLVVGPNGSGKSSLCRAVRALLWPSAESTTVSADSRWTTEDGEILVERQWDRVRWQRGGLDVASPELPESRFSRCFNLGVADLLLESDATDRTVVQEILRQMAGGFDLREVERALFSIPPQLGRKAAARLREFGNTLRARQQEESRLRDRERRLAGLARERAEAARARDELARLQTARDVVAARIERAAIETELAGHDPAMDRLSGGEIERLDELEENLSIARRRISECRAVQRAAEESIESVRLPDRVPDQAELGTWVERASQARRLEEQLEHAERELASADARLEQAREELGAAAGGGPQGALDGNALARLDAFLHEADLVRGARAALDAEAAMLEGAEDGHSRSQLEEASGVLRHWLAVAELRRAVRAPWIPVVGSLMLAAGVAAVLASLAAGWSAVGAGCGLLLVWIWLLLSPAGRQRLDADRTRFESTGMEAPSEWDRAGVEVRLRELQEALAAAVLDSARRTRLARVEASARALEPREERLQEERVRLSDALGVDAGQGDLNLALLARRIDAVREAREVTSSGRAGRDAPASRMDGASRPPRRDSSPRGARARAETPPRPPSDWND